MFINFGLTLFLLTCVFSIIQCAPTTNSTKDNDLYDFSKYDTIYDQKQNGSINVRSEIKEIAIVFVPKFSSFSPLSLINLDLWKSNGKVNKEQRMETIATPAAVVSTNVPKSAAQLIKEQVILPVVNVTNITPGSLTASMLRKGVGLRVFKKVSPNQKLTLYLASRDLVVAHNGIDKLTGVLLVDPEFVEDRKVYGQVTLTFRYGREDEEVMGLKFCNEAIMCLAQLYPPHPGCPEVITPLQVSAIKVDSVRFIGRVLF